MKKTQAPTVAAGERRRRRFRTDVFFVLSVVFMLSATHRVFADLRSIATGTMVSQDYQILLPPLPSGVVSLNTVFLHGDAPARPYRVEDFHSALEAAGVLDDVKSIGSYQYNHLWIVTLSTLSAKERLLQSSELTAKGKRCMRLYPNKAELRVRLHWVPYHLPNFTIEETVEKYGYVEEVMRETWRVPGFQGIKSTTRNVRLLLYDGVTLKPPPHQLLLQGCTILVLVSGRPPQCLRCQQTGHIRRYCRMPKCKTSGRFGHLGSDCVRTYATAANVMEGNSAPEPMMNQQQPEEAATSLAIVEKIMNMNVWFWMASGSAVRYGCHDDLT